MILPHTETLPQFSRPFRQILLMLTVLGMTGAGAFVALPAVLPVFQANPYLNSCIAFVFAIGVLVCFFQVFQLVASVRWIEMFAAGDRGQGIKSTTLLASMASMLRSHDASLRLSATSTRSILDSVAARIGEQREITRYIVNMLILIGLLGTFYGLATTVPAVVETIRSLAPQEGDEGLDIFNRLMMGLESQLGGMGVAFASSLLGLAGSLVVGLLELFTGHGQNRFYRELEEWLSSMTRVSATGSEEDSGGLGVVGGVLDQMAEHLDTLRGIIAASEASRVMTDERLLTLLDTVAGIAERLDNRDPVAASMERVAAGQGDLIDLLRSREVAEPIDAESRMRLRSIDVQLLRLLDEFTSGRQELVELRQDLDRLARALAVTREASPRKGPLPDARDGD